MESAVNGRLADEDDIPPRQIHLAVIRSIIRNAASGDAPVVAIEVLERDLENGKGSDAAAGQGPDEPAQPVEFRRLPSKSLSDEDGMDGIGPEGHLGQEDAGIEAAAGQDGDGSERSVWSHGGVR